MKINDSKNEVWLRLGEELKLLYRFVLDICCDVEYQSILTKKDMAKINQALKRIDSFKCECEDVMFRKSTLHDTHVFYGCGSEAYDKKLETIRNLALRNESY